MSADQAKAGNDRLSGWRARRTPRTTAVASAAGGTLPTPTIVDRPDPSALLQPGGATSVPWFAGTDQLLDEPDARAHEELTPEVEPGPAGAPLPPTRLAPAPAPVKRRRRPPRPRVRRVTRVVRRIDAWGVFKISLVFFIVLYAVLLVAGVLLWAAARTTGTIDNAESFIRELFALDTFTFDGQQIFRASWVLGAILVVAGTGAAVTAAVLFNLISDLVGGVRVLVLEEEVIRWVPDEEFDAVAAE